jgi:uncharacterized protein HemX
MNDAPQNGGPAGQNVFWVLLALCVVLGLDGAFRLSDLLRQREQLDQARLVQAQTASRLAQNQQAQARLEPISFELLQIATTNETAKKIVQEFNMQWNPSPSAQAPTAATNPSPVLSRPPPLLSNTPPTSSNLPPEK